MIDKHIKQTFYNVLIGLDWIALAFGLDNNLRWYIVELINKF